MHRLSFIALAAAAVALLPAGTAQAATKTIPVKVDLTGVVAFTDDLGGALKSKSSKCVKDRPVKLSGDFSSETTTDKAGGFQFEEGNLYDDGAWTVKAPESKKFGKPGHRKVCGADSAKYDYVDPGPWSITLDVLIDEAQGTATSIDDACQPASVYLYRDGSEISNTTVNGGSFTFGPGSAIEAGSYQAMGPGTVNPVDSPDGDYEYVECYGQSNTINVLR